MPQKFYLHRATTTVTGTLPGASSVSTTTPDVTASGASTNLNMDGTISAVAETSQLLNTLAQTGLQKNWFRRWVTPTLAAQSISSGTWTVSAASNESNVASNMLVFGIVLYRWRPSDGSKASIFDDPTSGATEPAVSQTASTTNVTGSAVTLVNGDIIVLEIWAQNTQSNATARTNVIYYDGTTEASSSNIASFLNAPASLTLFSSIVGSDTGTGTEGTPTILANLTTQTDSGTGTEGTPTLLASSSQSDTGTGTEGAESISAEVSSSDSGTGTEDFSLLSSIDQSDTAFGIEGTPTILASLTTQADAAVGSEGSEDLLAELPDSDAGVAVEGPEIIDADISDSDSATAIETENVDIIGFVTDKSGSDTASGDESESIDADVSDSDSATAAESESVEAIIDISSSDSATASETESVTILAPPTPPHILSPTGSEPFGLSSVLPSFIDVRYGGKRCSGVASDTVPPYYLSETPIWTACHDIAGSSGKKIFRDWAQALFPVGAGNPTNRTALDNLTDAVAEDYCKWHLTNYENVINGIVLPNITGLDYEIEWFYGIDKYGNPDAWTRLKSAPLNNEVEELMHFDPAEDACTTTKMPCIEIYSPLGKIDSNSMLDLPKIELCLIDGRLQSDYTGTDILPCFCGTGPPPTCVLCIEVIGCSAAKGGITVEVTYPDLTTTSCVTSSTPGNNFGKCCVPATQIGIYKLKAIAPNFRYVDTEKEFHVFGGLCAANNNVINTFVGLDANPNYICCFTGGDCDPWSREVSLTDSNGTHTLTLGSMNPFGYPSGWGACYIANDKPGYVRQFMNPKCSITTGPIPIVVIFKCDGTVNYFYPSATPGFCCACVPFLRDESSIPIYIPTCSPPTWANANNSVSSCSYGTRIAGPNCPPAAINMTGSVIVPNGLCNEQAFLNGSLVSGNVTVTEIIL